MIDSLFLQEVLERCKSSPVWAGHILLCRMSSADEKKYQGKMDELIDRYENFSDYLPDNAYSDYYGCSTWLQDLDGHIAQEEAKADLIKFIEYVVQSLQNNIA